MKRAILFDRDGTLIEDRPPNSDASAVDVTGFREVNTPITQRVGCETREAEIRQASLVASDLVAAVRRALDLI
jgi:hypothetical protein